MHNCPISGCKARVSDDVLMCRRHWAQVPPLLQREVYRAWDRGMGRGTDRHLVAMRAAIAAVQADNTITREV